MLKQEHNYSSSEIIGNYFQYISGGGGGMPFQDLNKTYFLGQNCLSRIDDQNMFLQLICYSSHYSGYLSITQNPFLC